MECDSNLSISLGDIEGPLLCDSISLSGIKQDRPIWFFFWFYQEKVFKFFVPSAFIQQV